MFGHSPRVLVSVRFDQIGDLRSGPSSDAWNTWLDQYHLKEDYYDALHGRDPSNYPRITSDKALAVLYDPLDGEDGTSLSLLAADGGEAREVLQGLYLHSLVAAQLLTLSQTVHLSGYLLFLLRKYAR